MKALLFLFCGLPVMAVAETTQRTAPGVDAGNLLQTLLGLGLVLALNAVSSGMASVRNNSKSLLPCPWAHGKKQFCCKSAISSYCLASRRKMSIY